MTGVLRALSTGRNGDASINSAGQPTVRWLVQDGEEEEIEEEGGEEIE